MTLCSDFRDRAAQELELAELKLNQDGSESDYYSGANRQARADYHVARAQVYATLAIAVAPAGGGV